MFEWNLEEHIFTVHNELMSGTYQHGGYQSFYVCDPKRRHIHKPSVRDRLVHHAIFRVIEPLFNRQFVFDVWSCRNGKGMHRAIERFQRFAWKVSKNNTRTVWVLKMDIRTFFASVDQDILIKILERTILDSRTRTLLTGVIRSFPAGIPLGNLTSQLFANVYLNALDQFVKSKLGKKWYLRYCDDFVILHEDRNVLQLIIPLIRDFLSNQLSLELHPKKCILGRYHRGIDFLGHVCFPYYCVLRTKTRRRMMRRLTSENCTSYYGLIQRTRAFVLRKQMEAVYSALV